MKVDYGNLVEVKTKDKIYRGILIPRAEVIPGNYLVLKLANGYNVGISKREVKKIKLIKKVKRKISFVKKIELKKDLPIVSVLSTGGTISCKVDYITGGVYPALSADEIIENIPEITNFADIRAREIMKVPSEDMNPRLWRRMAREVVKELNSEAEGVVITHGTDCMHYSSAMLAFMIKNLNKPIVFTGSQRSSDRGSSDAFQNLLCSIIACANGKIAESMICMHAGIEDNFNFLLRGVKAR
ncbi:MAG: asparaginase domain-containing protein, partial [Candidatus Nanoarchaeia archaeon]|nr:asparaginase domain-containing protein [Candidatus Jingweiarchaeum tengchongense]